MAWKIASFYFTSVPNSAKVTNTHSLVHSFQHMVFFCTLLQSSQMFCPSIKLVVILLACLVSLLMPPMYCKFMSQQHPASKVSISVLGRIINTAVGFQQESQHNNIIQLTYSKYINCSCHIPVWVFEGNLFHTVNWRARLTDASPSPTGGSQGHPGHRHLENRQEERPHCFLLHFTGQYSIM